MLGQAGSELGDLAVQLGDDAYRTSCPAACIRGRHSRGRSGQPHWIQYEVFGPDLWQADLD